MTAIMGPSGAGKTTLLHCSAGLPVTAEVTAVLDGGSAVPHLILPPGTGEAAAPERATVLLDEAQGAAVDAAAAKLNTSLRDAGIKVTPPRTGSPTPPVIRTASTTSYWWS